MKKRIYAIENPKEIHSVEDESPLAYYGNSYGDGWAQYAKTEYAELPESAYVDITEECPIDDFNAQDFAFKRADGNWCDELKLCKVATTDPNVPYAFVLKELRKERLLPTIRVR